MAIHKIISTPASKLHKAKKIKMNCLWIRFNPPTKNANLMVCPQCRHMSTESKMNHSIFYPKENTWTAISKNCLVKRKSLSRRLQVSLSSTEYCIKKNPGREKLNQEDWENLRNYKLCSMRRALITWLDFKTPEAQMSLILYAK